MRLVILALLLALAAFTAQAYPLHGGNENVSATLFGVTRTPLEDPNATQEILKLDVGIVGAENATYSLMDSKNNTFEPDQYQILQTGEPANLSQRQIVYFLIPKDDLFKLINVTPVGAKPFNINWWLTPKGAKGDAIVRYYGITDWLTDTDSDGAVLSQGVVLQLRVSNNGTNDLYLSPENFTLLDQWGWVYYPTLGFDPEVIAPGNATQARVKLGFTGLSFLSRPAKLAYDGQTILDLEKDQGPLSDYVVYGRSAAQASVSPTSGPTGTSQAANGTGAASAGNQTQANNTSKSKISSLQEEIAASRARLQGVSAELSSKSPVGSDINSSVDEATQRLELMKKSNQQSEQTA
jgi:hypothetical protein